MVVAGEWCEMFIFFFFKQKTAYEMLRSLVGSEMCIRDRGKAQKGEKQLVCHDRNPEAHFKMMDCKYATISTTVSYTHLTLPTIYSV